jgi:hypothetical protein
MNITSVMSAPNMPADIGVERAVILCRPSFNQDINPDGSIGWRTKTEIWNKFDRKRMAKLVGSLPAGATVVVNFEEPGEPGMPFSYAPTFGPDDEGDAHTDAANARNLAAIGRVAKMLKLVRSVNPGVNLCWNAIPVTMQTRTPWRGQEFIPDWWYTRNEFINRALVKNVVPLVDSVAGQVYLNDADDIESVRAFIRLYLDAYSGFGKPVGFLTSPWYVGPRGSMIAGQPLADLLYTFRAVNLPLILWGSPPAGTPWDAVAKSDEWRQGWLRAAN